MSRLKSRAVTLGAALVTAVLAAGLGAPAASAGPAAAQHCAMTRTGEYQNGSPAALGLDQAKLQDALGYASLMGSDTIKVFRYGCLAGQGLRDALLDRIPNDNWGQAKAITAILTGIAADKGWVDIDKPIGTYLPAGYGDAAHRAVTLRQLLQAASGAQVEQVAGLAFFGDDSRAGDWMSHPIVHKPGTYYEYDQTAPSIITYLLQKVIDKHQPGLDFQDWAQRTLFDNLGIPRSAYFWQRDRAGDTTGYSQLWLRPLEFGRIGQLLLDDGRYQGKQVLSADYVRQLQAQSPSNCGYGFYVFENGCRPGQHQVNHNVPQRKDDYGGVPWVPSAPADMYFTDGVGIHIYVIPSLDMVVTRSGLQEIDAVPAALSGNINHLVPGAPDGPGTHEFFRKLMSAVTDMPASVRRTIANSGPYDRAPEIGADLTQFVVPPDQIPASLLALGPNAPAGCTPLGCADHPNNGYERFLLDIPRTVPGVVGLERRPDGGS